MQETRTMERGAWARALISGFPGPAVIVSHDGNILVRNRAAAGVLTIVESEGERLRGDLGERAEALAKTDLPDRWLVSIDGAGIAATRSFLIAAITFPGDSTNEPIVALLAWENTLETSLRSALSESRAFFRDLATSSSDFIWATDVNGIITYASPSGFRGKSPTQLHGMHWRDMFSIPEDRDAAAPVFGSETVVEDQDIWFGSGGERSCFRMNARPIVTQQGEWRGARGIARNVTDLMMRELETSQVQASDDQLKHVLHNIRNEVDPHAMLSTAASSITDVMGFDGCWIFLRRIGDVFNADTASVIHVVPTEDMARLEAGQSASLKVLATRVAADGNYRPEEGFDESWHYLAVPARHSDKIYGVVCFGQLSRPGDFGAVSRTASRWDETGIHAAIQIAEQVAVAIAQTELLKRLRSLNKTDALTGLVNRHAFIEEASRRLGHHQRMQRRAALLVLDIDDFRRINDFDGQRRGDEVLVTVARLIESRTRDSDLAARFDGDEFALWLEESDQTVALLKAIDLIEGCAGLNERSHMGRDEDLGPPIGLSIGIAVFDPSRPEGLDDMIVRASTALDETRSAGKGGYRVAAPAKDAGYEPQSKQSLFETRPETGSAT